MSNKENNKDDNNEYFDADKLIKLILLSLLLLFFKIYSRISKYYPFSEFFKDKQWHYDNQNIRKIGVAVLELSKKLKLDLELIKFEKNNFFNIIHCSTNKKSPNKKFIKFLPKKLNVPESEIIVRQNNKIVNILVKRK
ncbi:hypothetical protein ACFLZ1_01220 [Patescibacteria group bacterium]